MITAAVSNGFKTLLLSGGFGASDALKIALYVDTATLDATTAAYTTAGEVADGGGYAAGGLTLSGKNISIAGGIATMSFTESIWTTASITARGALIYNSTQSNAAVAVLNFGKNKISTDGDFKVSVAVRIQ